MSDRLAGRIALITGGTSGIGEASAEAFVRQGASVMIAGRSRERGEAIARKLGDAVAFVEADIVSEAGVKAAIDATVDRFGRIDVLFSNAGGPTPGTIETLTERDLAYATSLLLGSVLFGMKHAAPIMKAAGWGRIVNTTSVAALRGHMGEYLYSILKAGVTHATRLAAIELGRHGVTVNAISPGAVATPIFFGGSGAADGLDPEHAKAKLAKLTRNLDNATPRGVSGLPEDIAMAAVYLASEEARHVNGHDLVVDGGMIQGGRTSYAQ